MGCAHLDNRQPQHSFEGQISFFCFIFYEQQEAGLTACTKKMSVHLWGCCLLHYRLDYFSCCISHAVMCLCFVASIFLQLGLSVLLQIIVTILMSKLIRNLCGKEVSTLRFTLEFVQL